MAFSLTPPVRDRPVAHSLALRISMPRRRFPEMRRRPRRQPSSRSSAAIPPAHSALIPPHGAHRSGERRATSVCWAKPELHQEHHRIGLGDRILGTIVMHRQSSDDDQRRLASIRKLQRALITTVFEAPARAAPRLVGCSYAELERTSLSPQAPRKTFAGLGSCVLPTRKTGHVLVRTRGTERPVISVVKSAMSGG